MNKARHLSTDGRVLLFGTILPELDKNCDRNNLRANNSRASCDRSY
ncbi:hypothetical protein COO91_08346 [Nostoc flagelliforme CCNUN1]|uniref:Uncharacterized protein n=1 Tax=Nostoc flagelliforme CCNUN1 TaxID=2038116 RepID=A0A2K8T3G5_9NOSO|nr:hypothetical protein COO91_08346 [Nostoc flagelliforme CCNUN1]